MVLNKFLFYGLSKPNTERYSELSEFLENIKSENPGFKYQFITKRSALFTFAKAFQSNSPDRFLIFVDESLSEDISALHADFLSKGLQVSIYSLNFSEPDCLFLKNRLVVEESFSANMHKLSEQVTQLSKNNTDSSDLTEEVNRQKQLIAERDKKIQELESTISSMQVIADVDIDVCETAEYKELLSTCDKLQHRIDFMLSDNESVIKQLNDELAKKDTELSEKAAEISKKDAEITEKDTEIANLKNVAVTDEDVTGSILYQTLKASNDDLQAQLDQLTDLTEKLRADLAVVEEEKKSLQSEILDLTGTITVKQNEIEQLHGQNESNQSEIQAKAEELTQQITQLNEFLTERDNKIEELSKALEVCPNSEEYERLLADVDELKGTIAENEKKAENQDTLISELQSTITSKDSEIEKLKQDFSDKSAELEAVDLTGFTSKIEELTNTITDKESVITELQKTVSEQSADYQRTIDEKEQAFAEVQAELETLRQDFVNLQTEQASQIVPEIAEEDITGSDLYKNLESKLDNVQELLAEKENLISSLQAEVSEQKLHEISDDEVRESSLYKILESELRQKNSEISELKDKPVTLTDTDILSSKLYKDLLSEKISLGLQLENQGSVDIDVTSTPEYKTLLAEKDKVSAELQEALLSALNGGAELTEDNVKDSVWYQNLAVSEQSLINEVDTLKRQIAQLESSLTDNSSMSVQLRNLRIEKDSLNSSLASINKSLMYNSFSSQVCSFMPLSNVCAYSYGSEFGRNILINRLIASLRNMPSRFVIFDLSSDLKYSSIFQSQVPQFLDKNTSVDVLFNEKYKGISLVSLLQSQSKVFRYSVFNGFTFMLPDFFASLYERLSSLVSEGYTVIFLLNSIMDTSVQYFLKNFSSFGMTSVTLKADLKVSLYAYISIMRFINLPKSSTIYLVDTFESPVLQSLDSTGLSIVNNFMQEHPSVICKNSQQQAEIEKISLFNCERV